VSKLSTLEQAEKSLRKTLPELEKYREAEPPIELLDIWWCFLELSSQRSSNGSGSANPVSFRDMYYWQQVKGINLGEFEQDVILNLDRIWMKVHTETLIKNAKKSADKPAQKTKLPSKRR